MIDIVITFVFYRRIDCTVNPFQFHCREVQHGSDPFRRVEISCIDSPAVYQLGRTGEQSVEDMVRQEHVQGVVLALQRRLVPIKFFVCLSFFRIHFVQSEDAGGSIVAIFFYSQVIQGVDLFIHGHALVETVAVFLVKYFVGYDEKRETAIPMIGTFAHIILVSDTHAWRESGIIVFPLFVAVIAVTRQGIKQGCSLEGFIEDGEIFVVLIQKAGSQTGVGY